METNTGNAGVEDRRTAQSEDFLDREHQARVARTASCDTAADRRAAAESEMGLLTEEEQQLLAERKALGQEEHVTAIEGSGWYPYKDPLRRALQLMFALDVLMWVGLLASIAMVAWRAYNS